jgi:hypothetical protein
MNEEIKNIAAPRRVSHWERAGMAAKEARAKSAGRSGENASNTKEEQASRR